MLLLEADKPLSRSQCIQPAQADAQILLVYRFCPDGPVPFWLF